MKQQLAISMAGLMLLTAGRENADGKTPFSAIVTGMQTTKPEKAQNVGEKNIHDQWQGKSNPSLYAGGFFVRGDFLYWRADEDGLQYGFESKIDIAAPKKISRHGLFPKVKWDPGFRVGIGYTFSSQDYWDLMALWTHFQTHQSDSKSVDLDLSGAARSLNAIIPWWGATTLGTFGDKASVRWGLTYNTYDLDLGRNYFVAKTFSVHPFVGVRGATIKQKYHTKYEALIFNPNPAFAPTAFKANTDFWGVGAHLGTALQWHCTSGFSFFGNVGGSLLYANYKLNEKYDALMSFTNASPTTTIPSTIKDHFTKGALNLEAMIGFQWEKFFHQNKYRFSITAGYEWSEWFSQNQITKVDIIPPDPSGLGFNSFVRAEGDLTLQGANFQLRLDF